MKGLKNLRITHQKANVDIRGKFSLTTEERLLLYSQFKEYFSISEALILSTCNRTELYYVHIADLSEKLIKLLCSIKGVKSEDYLGYFTHETSDQASLNHLFRVAMGLESQVLGDNEIFGQIKKSYQESTETGMSGTLMHRALHHLFFTHKKVCQESGIKDGAASVSYNVTNLLIEKNVDPTTAKLLVVGAGKMGSDVCRHLTKKGFSNLNITNRTLEKSLRLHLEIGVNVISFDDIFSQLEQYDVIISAVSMPSPLFSGFFSKKKKYLAIDLCSPASFNSYFIKNFTSDYFDIDAIGKMTADTLENRKQFIPQVESIIASELDVLGEWVETHDNTREIKRFKETLEALRKRSIAKYIKNADDEQRNMIDELSSSIIHKIVKLPALQLKQACERDRADQLGQTLNELFNLEYQPLYNLKQEQS
ncbi:MAG: glutamyl-tRNA reductase [Cyclobacteriaceae bacterium]